MKCPQCFFTRAEPTDDDCRRCSRNFTRSELVEVVIVGFFYLLLCRFAHYLFTGEFFRRFLVGGLLFPISGFRDLFVFPVNVGEYPWHILTAGLTLSAAVLVPGVVGMFYGLAPGVVVALVGGWHVPAPLFVVPAVASAVIAARCSVRKLRAETTLLLAAGVPAAYLLALAGPSVWQRIGAVAWLPLAVMVLVTAAATLVILWLARRREYDVRFLAWSLGFVTLVVLVLFYGSVGFSKIEYEFVRAGYSVEGPRFRIVVDAPSAEQTQEERHERALSLYAECHAGSLRRFTRFIEWFPRAPETARARFERAELLNARTFFTRTTPDFLSVYTDRITREALVDYGIVREEYGAFPAAVEARLHAGRYFLQHSQAPEGRKRDPLAFAESELSLLVDFCEVKLMDYRPVAAASMLGRWRQHRLSYDEHMKLLDEVRVLAKRDLAFLREHDDFNRIPLMLYLQLDPREKGYDNALADILRWFPDCRLADNLRLELVLRRSHTLDEIENLLEEYPSGDAAPRMMLVLARGYHVQGKTDRAREMLERLIRDFPGDADAPHARDFLKELDADAATH